MIQDTPTSDPHLKTVAPRSSLAFTEPQTLQVFEEG